MVGEAEVLDAGSGTYKMGGGLTIRKGFFYTALIAAVLYAGDRLNVADKISDAYNSVKNAVVDVCTIDAGEASKSFIKQVEEEKDIGKYATDIANAMYAASEAIGEPATAGAISEIMADMPDSLAEDVISDRVREMDPNYQMKVVESAGGDLLRQKRDAMELWLRRLYRDTQKKVDEFLRD